MIKFKASIIATSALKCATEEKDGAITMLNKIHVDEMVNLCFDKILSFIL